MQTSLRYSSTGEMKKGSVGKSLIPVMRKAGSLAVGSAAGSLRRSLKVDLQESGEMRPGSSSISHGKTSEQSGLTGYPLAKGLSLANPSMLLPSKPLLPIPKSSLSPMANKIRSREPESGKLGSGWDEEIRGKEITSADNGSKTSLRYSSTGEMKKGSVGKSLIPVMRKAGSLAVGSAAGSLRRSLKVDLQESGEMRPESSSTSQEKTSEHSGLTGYPLAKRLSLANPSMLLPSKPLLPIPKSYLSPMASKIWSRERETGKLGSGWDEEIRGKEITSEDKGCQTSLHYYCGGEMKKGAFGKSLIPVMRKAGSLAVGSAAGSLHTSLQEDLKEFQEMRPRPSSVSREKTSEHSGLTDSSISRSLPQTRPSSLLPPKPLPPIQETSSPIKPSKMFDAEKMSTGDDDIGRSSQERNSERKGHTRGIFGALKSARHLQESLLPFPGFPLSQAKEMDHPSSPGRMRDNSGKVRNKDRDKQTSFPVAVYAQNVTENHNLPLLGGWGFSWECFSLPPVNGTASSMQRKPPGSAIKKKVVKKQDNIPLLPSTLTLHGDDSFPRSSSGRAMAGASPGAAAPTADPLLTVTPQTATGAKRREEPLRGRGQKDKTFSDPQKSLQEALSMLGSDDWELKKKGLFNIPCLAESHPEVVLGRLREICLAVTSEVSNLRSMVSCSAIVSLGELFTILKKDMDSEVDEVAEVLLHVVWNSPEFIYKEACQSLGMMVENVTPVRAMTALIDRGVKSRYVQVRKCAAELLLSLMEKMGVTKLAGTPRAERLAHVAGTLAQDCHKDTRHYGQEMVKMLLNNKKFKKLLEQSLSPHDLEDILRRIKKKGMENQKAECPSVKEPVEKRKDTPKKPQDTLPSSKRVKSAPGGRLLHRPKAQATLPATVEGRESLQKLYHLLEAKGFQTRMEGVALLLDLCKSSPQLISSNIVQIFDRFVLRINDTHKKVKQQALEVLAEMIGLLEDALNPVLIHLVEGITKNLNSKDPGVHPAAVRALDKSVAHLDEVSLMKELCHQWSQLSGEALLDVTERITVLVEWVHARSPEVVQRYALPVLWCCLENKALPVRSANVCAVVTKLACALCEVMGTQLIKCAESKPPHVQENLSSLLGCHGMGGLKELQTEGKVKTKNGSDSHRDLLAIYE
ncbi:TOG array regulator of axonemal microtubules protein 2-like [Molothrus aeneus]|uniref:TOG array regulator of axonemal microtubules protein 2-like n=1 Tax=Molothrus aeneus TaxID=84833 RepID=UPI00345B26E3